VPYIAGGSELGHDPVCRALGDPNALANLAQADAFLRFIDADPSARGVSSKQATSRQLIRGRLVTSAP
jgi:hypothetical protein